MLVPSGNLPDSLCTLRRPVGRLPTGTGDGTIMGWPAMYAG